MPKGTQTCAFGPPSRRHLRRLIARGHGTAPIFILSFFGRNRIDALEPATEVNIRAAATTKRLIRGHSRLAAYRARAQLGYVCVLRHRTWDLARADPGVPKNYPALSQPNRIGYPSPANKVVVS